MTKHLEEIFQRIKNEFGNKPFTIDEAILLPRPRYNLDRLVNEKKLKSWLNEGGGICTWKYKVIEDSDL